MRIFIGVDPRSPISYNVLQWSIVRNASKPVQIVPLVLPQLPIKRRGLTDFTFTRYLPPYLCNYRGTSIFLDADMVVEGDIHELASHMDGKHSVYVAKHQQRFEWPSMMVFNNEKCQRLTQSTSKTKITPLSLLIGQILSGTYPRNGTSVSGTMTMLRALNSYTSRKASRTLRSAEIVITPELGGPPTTE